MIILKIDNSECKIEGLSLEQHKALRNILYYQESEGSAFFSGRFGPAKRYLIDKNGVFPTGLLYLVQEHFKSTGIKHAVEDSRKRPASIIGAYKLSLPLAPYPDQISAALACLRSSRGIVVAPTGTGKSLIAALIINQVRVKTLMVVPSLELKSQLTKTLSGMFSSQKVGSIRDKADIAIENVDALSTDKVLEGYDCVIIDEFHHSGAKTYRKLNKKAWSKVYYKFGLTATPFRSQDHEKLLLESVLSEVIYEIEYREAVDKGYIVPLEAYYYEVPKTVIKGKENSWPAMYSELVVNNSTRNGLIKAILHKLDDVGVSSLCLVKEVKHGELLKTDTVPYFAHGENEDTPHLITLFNQGKLKTLIGTTGVLGEGVDTKPAEYVIIAGLGKSKNSLMQSFGRGFRVFSGKESCKIILILDKSHKYTRNHFKTQCKVLFDEYGVVPVKLEI